MAAAEQSTPQRELERKKGNPLPTMWFAAGVERVLVDVTIRFTYLNGAIEIITEFCNNFRS